jgi:hypothetical protein
MSTTWRSMWKSLVLSYQPAVRGSYDGKTAGMFGEAVMAEPWDRLGTAAMAKPIKHKRVLLGGCNAHTGSETSVDTLQARQNH